MISDVSVVVPVHYDSNQAHVDDSLSSIFSQTLPPDEVIVVKDGSGENPDLNRCLRDWEQNESEVTVTEIEEKHTLGYALQTGLEEASNELIARMDSDDICRQNRFEKQLHHLESHPEVDVLGGYVEEFRDDPGSPHSLKKVPLSAEDVVRTSKYRCPVNHPTVMYRKSSVLSVGGYKDMNGLEDYDLWLRMLDDGCVVENLSEVLVSVRADESLYARRGGTEYFKKELNLFVESYRRGQISAVQLLANVVLRAPVRLVPNSIRERIYSRFLRS